MHGTVPSGPRRRGDRPAPSQSTWCGPSPRRFASYCLIVGIFVAVGAVLWRTSGVLLYGFAGVLLAVLLDACARIVAHIPRVSRRVALGLTIVLMLGIAALLGALLGPSVADQVDALKERLPEAYGRVEAWILGLPGAESVIASLGGPEALSPDANAVLTGTVGAFSRAFGILGNVAMVVVIGIFGAGAPEVYRRGAVGLLPPERRDVADEILCRTVHGLRRWLLGRFAAMCAVGVLTGVGLWIAQIPLALTLGLLAGLLSFIPFLGPVLGAILPLLLGLMDGPATAGGVVIVFAVVQFLEGNLITPLIERHAVSMPPAVTIFAQVLMGTLAGAIGLLLASPVLVVLRATMRATCDWVHGDDEDEDEDDDRSDPCARDDADEGVAATVA
ncbi:MAG: AI-2E family transporter [Nannocystaceae bacterium]